MTNTLICKDMYKSIKKVVGKSSNSSSPTDTWILSFVDGTNYNKTPINTCFLKMYITNNSLPIENQNDYIKGLDYERIVYKYIIKPLISYDICGNFIKFLDRGLDCTYKDLFNILNGHLYNGKTLINHENVYHNLNRNIYYMLNQESGRPGIDKNDTIEKPITINQDLYSRFKFNLLLTEIPENNISFTDWIEKNQNTSSFEKNLFDILLQICYTCITMNLRKIAHNDLHSGNILIKDTETENIYIYVHEKTINVIKTRYFSLTYDFDRSYSVILGKNSLLEYNDEFFCKHGSQCNTVINNKDIIKILCHVYHAIESPFIKRKILNLITSDVTLQLELIIGYNLSPIGYCWFIDSSGNSLPEEWYSKFNNLNNIFTNIRNNIIFHKLGVRTSIKKIFYLSSVFFDNKGEVLEEKLKEFKSHVISYMEKTITKDGMGKRRKSKSKKRT